MSFEESTLGVPQEPQTLIEAYHAPLLCGVANTGDVRLLLDLLNRTQIRAQFREDLLRDREGVVYDALAVATIWQRQRPACVADVDFCEYPRLELGLAQKGGERRARI